jgi:hypothetical protein
MMLYLDLVRSVQCNSFPLRCCIPQCKSSNDSAGLGYLAMGVHQERKDLSLLKLLLNRPAAVI